MKLVECVPNFSEGRDLKIIDQISATIKAVGGVTLLDVDPGADTNRTVVTFVGTPDAAVEAAFQAISKAAELIDMSKHQGAHARMGATDVCPFIPVSEMTMEDCADLARKLGKRVGDELGIPVYLYENAASKPEWQNLAEVRSGEYEALPKKMEDPKWKPDFGPQKFNARSGATAIGAREFLIAYNINLNTRDKKKAHDLALTIRERGRSKRDKNGKFVRDAKGKKVKQKGLFTHCKAVGWFIDEYDRAQISINLTNFKITPPHLVLEKVRELAWEKGIGVTGSELVGLIPLEAMLVAGNYYLQRMGDNRGVSREKLIQTAIQSMGLEDLGPFEVDSKIIEYAIRPAGRLVDMTLTGFADELSSDSPAPGGGSVAGLCVAISGALSSMVASLTFGKKGYKDVAEQVEQIAIESQVIKSKALEIIDLDTQAFNQMMDASRLPKKTDEEKAIRQKKIEEATQNAIMVPLETMKLAETAVRLSAQIAKIGNENALSDAGVGAILALSGAKGGFLNVKINMAGITDDSFRKQVFEESKSILIRVAAKCSEVEHEVNHRLDVSMS